MLSKLLLLSLSVSTLANIFVTSPTASSIFNGGVQATITWKDDGKAPTLKDFGLSKVLIYVGNTQDAQQQTSLQTIISGVNLSISRSIQFTPDPLIGPTSNQYFICFESLALKDVAAPQFRPALVFSPKFFLGNMKGTFSQKIHDQINSQSTGPLAGTTAATKPPHTISKPGVTVLTSYTTIPFTIVEFTTSLAAHLTWEPAQTNAHSTQPQGPQPTMMTPSSSKDTIAPIVGGVVGGLFFVFLVITVVIYQRRRLRRKLPVVEHFIHKENYIQPPKEKSAHLSLVLIKNETAQWRQEALQMILNVRNPTSGQESDGTVQASPGIPFAEATRLRHQVQLQNERILELEEQQRELEICRVRLLEEDVDQAPPEYTN